MIIFQSQVNNLECSLVPATGEVTLSWGQSVAQVTKINLHNDLRVMVRDARLWLTEQREWKYGS